MGDYTSKYPPEKQKQKEYEQQFPSTRMLKPSD